MHVRRIDNVKSGVHAFCGMHCIGDSYNESFHSIEKENSRSKVEFPAVLLISIKSILVRSKKK